MRRVGDEPVAMATATTALAATTASAFPGDSSPAVTFPLVTAWIALPGRYCRALSGRAIPMIPLLMMTIIRALVAPAVRRMIPPRPRPITLTALTARAPKTMAWSTPG